MMSALRHECQQQAYLDIRHDKPYNLIPDTLGNKRQAGPRSHRQVPHTLIPILTCFLLSKLLQQHTHYWLQRLPDEVMVDGLLTILDSLQQQCSSQACAY